MWIRRTRLVLLVSFAFLVGPAPAGALSIVVESVQLAPGATTTLDVFLMLDPGDTGLPDLAGWQGAVDLSGTGGVLDSVALTDASGTHPPIISSNFTPNLGGSDGSTRRSASADLSSGGTPIFDLAGLFQLNVTADLGAMGQILTLAIDPNQFTGTLLVDDVGDPIPFNAVEGTITVVPEPSTLSMAVLAMGGLLLTRARRNPLRARRV